MGIPENIKLLREQHGISQAQLAEIAGVTDKAVSFWENSVTEPRMGAIQKIADYFGIRKSNIIENGGMSAISTINHDFDPMEQLRSALELLLGEPVSLEKATAFFDAYKKLRE